MLKAAFFASCLACGVQALELQSSTSALTQSESMEEIGAYDAFAQTTFDPRPKFKEWASWGAEAFEDDQEAYIEQGFPFQLFKNNREPDDPLVTVTYRGHIRQKVWDRINPNYFHTAGGFKLDSIKKKEYTYHKHKMYTIWFSLKNGEAFGFILPHGLSQGYLLKVDDTQWKEEDEYFSKDIMY